MASGSVNGSGFKRFAESDITKSYTFSHFEINAWRSKDFCSGFVVLTNGSGSNIIGGTSVLISGLPIPKGGYSVQFNGAYGSGSDVGKIIRFRINGNGELQLWYGGSIPDDVAVSLPFYYFTNP